MCFSATASFIAGGSLGTIGIISLKKSDDSPKRLLAAVPIFFGMQQFIEGALWMSLGHPRLQAAATLAFMLFAYVFWPTYMPYVVWRNEPDRRRRKALGWFVWFGASVSLYLLYFILRGPILATLMGRGIAYDVPLPDLAVIPVAYVLAACGSCFVSSHRFLRIFGMTLVAALVISYGYYSFAFASVWCFFAAILSLIILAHLHYKPKVG